MDASPGHAGQAQRRLSAAPPRCGLRGVSSGASVSARGHGVDGLDAPATSRSSLRDALDPRHVSAVFEYRSSDAVLRGRTLPLCPLIWFLSSRLTGCDLGHRRLSEATSPKMGKGDRDPCWV